MVEFINKLTGGLMYVHETRVEEYEALGHVRATPASAEAPPPKGRGKGGGKRKAEKRGDGGA